MFWFWLCHFSTSSMLTVLPDNTESIHATEFYNGILVSYNYSACVSNIYHMLLLLLFGR